MAKEILVVDSDKGDLKEFQRIFGSTDYHLVFSESGEDALLRVKLFRPDLIIAGTALSEKNGYELCEAIKEDPDSRSIPFILLLDMFEDFSEKDQARLKPDGILSKPLHEGQVLSMVEALLKGIKPQRNEGGGKKMVLETFGDMGEERFPSGAAGGNEEEEIIDLVDVVEEQEAKMSIDDFVLPERDEDIGKMESLESWERLGEEEKMAAEEGLVLSLEGEPEGPKEVGVTPKKREEVLLKPVEEEEELFEKIELDDILEKVGEIELPSIGEKRTGPQAETPRKEPPPIRPIEEKPFKLEEFETALKKGVETEAAVKVASQQEELQPFGLEEIETKSAETAGPREIPIETKAERDETEPFPKDLLEGLLREEELKEEPLEGVSSVEEELVEERLKEEELKEETLEEEELFEEELLGEEGLPEGEIGLEEETLEAAEVPEKGEELDLFEELESIEGPKEEKGVVREVVETVSEEGARVSGALRQEMIPAFKTMDEQIEEVVSEKVKVVMEEFITRHVPEMAKEIVKLTMERIEKMVREIVPDLAEKMIEEEIKRLEKGVSE